MDPIKQQRPPGVDALFKGEPVGKSMLDDCRKWVKDLENRIDNVLYYVEGLENTAECRQGKYKE